MSWTTAVMEGLNDLSTVADELEMIADHCRDFNMDRLSARLLAIANKVGATRLAINTAFTGKLDTDFKNAKGAVAEALITIFDKP